jgi:spore coat protein U-like protein
MKFSPFGFALCFIALGLTSRPAPAATATASFSVTATVVSGCQVSAPAAVFGVYTAARAAPLSISSVSVNCTSPTAYNVSLSAGRATGAATPTATDATRKTAGSASELLGHGLLAELARTAYPGQLADKDTVTGSGGSGYYQLHAADGQSAGAQSFAPGPYADLIIVTVTY